MVVAQNTAVGSWLKIHDCFNSLEKSQKLGLGLLVPPRKAMGSNLAALWLLSWAPFPSPLYCSYILF